MQRNPWAHEKSNRLQKKSLGHLRAYLFSIARWWFQIFFIFVPKIGEDFQFDRYFSDGLKPPTRLDCCPPVPIIVTRRTITTIGAVVGEEPFTIDELTGKGDNPNHHRNCIPTPCRKICHQGGCTLMDDAHSFSFLGATFCCLEKGVFKVGCNSTWNLNITFFGTGKNIFSTI